MTPSRTEILRLYKELLRYSERIAFTDKKYYKEKIKREFADNKNATENITFLYEKEHKVTDFVSVTQIMYQICNSAKIRNCHKLIRSFCPLQNTTRGKKLVDKSMVPVFDEKDIEEQFIKGSGPGGSKVNKSVNCVRLLHKPTGLQVKVHDFRELQQNRKIARQKLIYLLDNLENGDHSVQNQWKNIQDEKSKKRIQKQKKLLEKKSKWKEAIEALK